MANPASEPELPRYYQGTAHVESHLTEKDMRSWETESWMQVSSEPSWQMLTVNTGLCYQEHNQDIMKN